MSIWIEPGNDWRFLSYGDGGPRRPVSLEEIRDKLHDVFKDVKPGLLSIIQNGIVAFDCDVGRKPSTNLISKPNLWTIGSECGLTATGCCEALRELGINPSMEVFRLEYASAYRGEHVPRMLTHSVCSFTFDGNTYIADFSPLAEILGLKGIHRREEIISDDAWASRRTLPHEFDRLCLDTSRGFPALQLFMPGYPPVSACGLNGQTHLSALPVEIIRAQSDRILVHSLLRAPDENDDVFLPVSAFRYAQGARGGYFELKSELMFEVLFRFSASQLKSLQELLFSLSIQPENFVRFLLDTYASNKRDVVHHLPSEDPKLIGEIGSAPYFLIRNLFLPGNAPAVLAEALNRLGITTN